MLRVNPLILFRAPAAPCYAPGAAKTTHASPVFATGMFSFKKTPKALDAAIVTTNLGVRNHRHCFCYRHVFIEETARDVGADFATGMFSLGKVKTSTAFHSATVSSPLCDHVGAG